MWFARLIYIFILATLVLKSAPSAAQERCPTFPKVKIWGGMNHKSVTRFVEKNMKGNWDEYIVRLKAIRHQLQNNYDQGKRVKIRLNNQRVILSGKNLLKYLVLTENRIEIVSCLAKREKVGKPKSKTIISKESGSKKIQEMLKPTKSTSIKGKQTVGLGLSILCVDCHGERGVSDDPLFPNLAGQNYSYLVKQLRSMRNTARDRMGIKSFEDIKRRKASKKYKSLLRNERSAELMDEVVFKLNDQQIYDLAAYYSSQPCGQSTTLHSMSVRPLIGDSCILCHGKKGVSKIARMPNIAGQHFDYLRDQLVAFKLAGLEAKTGTENIALNRSMALKVAELGIKDIEELAAYFSALPCR